MKLNGKNIVMVIASTNFRDEEYAEPRKVIEDAGAHVTVGMLVAEHGKGQTRP